MPSRFSTRAFALAVADAAEERQRVVLRLEDGRIVGDGEEVAPEAVERLGFTGDVAGGAGEAHRLARQGDAARGLAFVELLGDAVQRAHALVHRAAARAGGPRAISGCRSS
jgi:hypothetical protein